MVGLKTVVYASILKSALSIRFGTLNVSAEYNKLMSNLFKGPIANVESSVERGVQHVMHTKQTLAPVALELEKLTINQPMSPYSLALKASESLDQLNVPLTLTLDSFRYGVNPFGPPLFHRMPPGSTLEMDTIFRRDDHYGEEVTQKHRDNSNPGRSRKSRQNGKSKQTVQVKSLEAGAGELYLRLDRHASMMVDDREQTALRKVKSVSEPTTEDSTSQTEALSFPGLAGSLPNFKKAICQGCKQMRLVFWFGDSTAKKRGDKYSCTECIKTMTGQEKFLLFFRIESLWTQPAYADIAEAKPLPPLKEYLVMYDEEKGDSQSVALSFLLDEKKLIIQSTLARMTSCLNSCKAKADLETQLFATRFLHDLLESMIRIGYIAKQKSIEKKLDCLDASEKAFYVPEVKRLAAQITALQEGPKGESDLLALNIHQRMPTVNHSQWFTLDFDDRHSLGKRDPWSRGRSFHHDPLENDQEAF